MTVKTRPQRQTLPEARTADESSSRAAKLCPDAVLPAKIVND
jgi:hypothetical protein